MDRPLQPNQLINTIQGISSEPVTDPVQPGIQGAIIGIIEGLLGSKHRRQTLLYRLFPGKWGSVKTVTTKDLLPGQWSALYRWIEPQRYEEGDKTPWYGSADFVTEATLLMAEPSHGIKEGQEHLDQGHHFFESYCIGRFGQIPTMQCGCEATALTALGTPFCETHAEAGKNRKAYKLQADITVKELKDAE
jgi:hypothetical protein